MDEVHTCDFASMYVHEGILHNRPHICKIFDGLWKSINAKKGAGTVGEDASSLAAALTRNPYQIVLTGYTGNADVLEEIWLRIAELKNLTHPPIWIMDPCMGDNGRLYVAPAVRQFYVKNIGTADILTPNEHELRWLTEHKLPLLKDGTPIEAVETDTLRRIKLLHDEGVPIVCVTSVALNQDLLKTYLSIGESKKTRGNSSHASPRLFTVTFPRIDVFIGGCGDSFNALLAHQLSSGLASDESRVDLNLVDWADVLNVVVSRMRSFVEHCVKMHWTSVVVPKVVRLPPTEVCVEEMQLPVEWENCN